VFVDFADDIVLMHESWEGMQTGMQTSTSAFENEAKKVGLVINVSETKIMLIDKWKSSAKIHVVTEELEECDEFCYLKKHHQQ